LVKARKNIIKEIAGNLNCGCDCYYNLKTEEIISIPNDSGIMGDSDFNEMFREDLDKIKQQKKDCIKVEVLQGFESYQIMADFVEQLSDHQFKLGLEAILNNKQPFRHFKYAIDHSDFRKDWFDFKQHALEKKIARLLNKELGAE
jgi:hypothetical protein